MDDLVSVFEARSKNATSSANSGATVSQAPATGSNDLAAVFAARSKPVNDVQNNASSTNNGHGTLYNAANSLLNRDTTYENHTGSKTLDKVLNFVDNLGNPINHLQGMAKGALSTAAGAGSIVNKVTGSSQPFNQDNLQALTVAHGLGQSIGKGAEQIGEFATGEGAAGKLAGTVGRIGASGALSAAQSGGDPIATVMGTVLPAIMSQPAVKAAGKLVGKYLDLKSGAGEGAIARAFLNPDSNGLSRVLKGSLDVNDVVNNLQQATAAYRDQAAATYSSRLANIKATQIPNWRTKSLRFIQNTDNKVSQEMKNFGITRSANGELNFRHFNGDEAKAKELLNTIDNWGMEGRDLTPAGLDILKKKIATYSDEGGSLGALASRVEEQAKQNLNAIIPGYSQMTKEYAEAQELLRKFKSEFSVSPSGGSNQGTISRKIQRLFAQNTNYKELLMSKIQGGNDILDQIAGLHLQSVMPKGILKALLGGYGLHGMTAVLSSPRLVGEGARVAGRVAQSSATPVVANGVRRAAQAGTDNAKPTGMLSGSQ